MNPAQAGQSGSSIRNILVLFHGMMIDGAPTPQQVDTDNYDVMKKGLNDALPNGASFDEATIIRVYWGFKNPAWSNAFTEEQSLSDAEDQSALLCPDARNAGDWITSPTASGVAKYVKNTVMRLGLTDAVFYASADGEFEVRWSVFSQIFSRLFPLIADPLNAGMSFRLHFVAHSLGVAVAHDLAYLLFGYRGTGLDRAGFFNPPPTFPIQPGQRTQLDDYKIKLAQPGLFGQGGRLQFGSFHAMEGQLPLFVFRNLGMVTALAQGARPMDPSTIGVDPSADRLQLQFFYVPNDVLGYPGLALYQNPSGRVWGREVVRHPYFSEALKGPLGLAGYHTSCWADSTVQGNIAEVIGLNWS